MRLSFELALFAHLGAEQMYNPLVTDVQGSSSNLEERE